MQAWAQRIKDLMDKADPKVTPGSLAADIKAAQPSVRQWFKPGNSGKTTEMISGDNLVAVAQRFRVSAEWIITGRPPVAVDAMPASEDGSSASGLSEQLLAEAQSLWRRIESRTDLGGGTEAGAVITAYNALLNGKDDVDATTAILEYTGRMGGGYGKRGETPTKQDLRKRPASDR